MWIEYTDIIWGLMLYIVLGCAWYHLACVSGICNVLLAVWRVYVWVQWPGVLYKKSMYAQTHTHIYIYIYIVSWVLNTKFLKQKTKQLASNHTGVVSHHPK